MGVYFLRCWSVTLARIHSLSFFMLLFFFLDSYEFDEGMVSKLHIFEMVGLKPGSY